MPVTLIAAETDEIADLINLVRSAADPDIGLVVPHGSKALQTPLNARLLSQFSRQTGRRTAIVSADPRVQELARANGMRVFDNVPAFERGHETTRATPSATDGNGADAAKTATVLTPPVIPATSPLSASPALSPPSYTPPPTVPPAPPRPRPRPFDAKKQINRRRLYIAGGIAGLIGLLLFLLLAPAATVTVTLAGAPLNVNPTIQGSTDPNAARAGDHILTQVLQATASGGFTATPTGQKQIPATSAKGTVTVTTNVPTGASFVMPQGDTFQTTDHAVTFVVTQTTPICIGPNGQPPTQTTCAANSAVPIQDTTAEAKGNVPANTITYWAQNPCANAASCIYLGQPFTFAVNNPQATSGGADQQQQTVASSSDVNGWNAQVSQIETNLTTQLNSQIQSQATGKTVAVDPSGGGKSLTWTVKPPLPAADQQFTAAQITIAGTAKASVYNMQDVQRDLLSDIKAQVTQGDQLGPNSFKPGSCQTTQAADDGTVILGCTASGFSQPVVNLEGLRGQLSGKNPGDANKIVQSKVDKVQDVEVSMFPFKLFYLPLISSRITIDENFVSQPASSG
ncbi:MAG TPA: hypothetical protein VF155_07710 [Candidatus Dormibacteraeota bacterium]